MITVDPARLGTAAVAVLAWLLLSGGMAWRTRRQALQRSAAAAALSPAAAGDAAPVLVVHASQTGTAETLAWQSARLLQLGAVPVRIATLASLTRDDLAQASRVLFIVSTYGEGDPPDSAAPFARNQMIDGPPLTGLHFGLLGLGDRSYTQFCGFGRSLDAWLQSQSARPIFERIEVDNSDPAALETWRHHLAHLAGTRDAPDWEAPAWQGWHLVERRLLNPGSTGGPAWHLELLPAEGQSLPCWQAGDLLQVAPPDDTAHPRDYSIASVPADGRVHLLVRESVRADGSPGLASHWLTRSAAPGQAIQARLRPHPGFRLGDNLLRPLILIGNGTGLAGLRSLLKARDRLPAESDNRSRNWLIFGERQAAVDRFHGSDIDDWLERGVLERCDRVYSRDGAAQRYVQHVVDAERDRVQAWVEAGAAIYVCGSLQGMAAAVDDALVRVLGRPRLDTLITEGRYRRDVY